MRLNQKFNIFLTFLIMPEWFSALGGGLISAAADIFNNERKIDSAWDLQKDAQSFNRAEREAAQQYNTSEREAAQEWNSEAAQMQRLMSVGVNPNNAVGSISHGGSSPASISPTSSPLSAVPQMANPLAGLADLMLAKAQIDNLNSVTEGNEINNQYLDAQNQLTVEGQKAAIDLARSDAAYKKSLKGMTDKEIAKYDELQDMVIKEGAARIEQYEAAVRQFDEQVTLMREQEKTEARKRQSMNAQDAASYASADASSASADLSRQQAQTEDEARASRIQNIQADTRNKFDLSDKLHQEAVEHAWKNACHANGLLPDAPATQMIGFALAHRANNTRVAVSAVLDSAKRAVTKVTSNSKSMQKRYVVKPHRGRVWNP